MKIQTEAAQLIAGVTPEKVFDFTTALHTFPSVFRGYGPLPGMVSEEIVGGGTVFTEGATRRVYSADKSVLLEKFTKITRPSTYIYDILSGLPLPFAWLVKDGRSEWHFTAHGNGTRLVWSFEFTLKSVLLWLPANFILQFLMRKAMQNCLRRISTRVTL